MVDSTGAITKTCDRDAFGSGENPSAANVNPFRCCVEYCDTETGLYCVNDPVAYCDETGDFLCWALK